MIKAFFAFALSLTAIWVVLLGWLVFMGLSSLLDDKSWQAPYTAASNESGVGPAFPI